ncbi:MAG: CoA-binding protein, partial [Pseudomonadota bacterium]
MAIKERRDGSRTAHTNRMDAGGVPAPGSNTGLGRFFEPKSVAVIGASPTPHKPGNEVLQNILANGYPGR